MSKSPKKRRPLVKTKEPYFIHKQTENSDLTFMIAQYALPWNEITNVPLCSAVIAKVEKVKKAFPEAHIEFNFSHERPAFIFNVVGRTKRSINDTPNQSVGDAVARAKATAKACTISRAIIRAALEGLEEELKRNLIVFEDWRAKEKNLVKGV